MLVACTSADSAEINVSAAASLTDVFTEIAEAFERDNPGTKITMNFGGSGSLAEQIFGGAPVDVFASASSVSMQAIGNQATNPTNFARNDLMIVTQQDNPDKLMSYLDLNGVQTVICQGSAPCGSTAVQFLDQAGLQPNIVSYEPDARAVLNKVVSGEANTGIVFRTDALSAGDAVTSISIPAEANITSDYQITVIKETKNLGLAQEFMDFVTSESGQSILKSAGFGAP